jgi:hypothetical protein
MTELSSGVIFLPSGITRMVSARIFPNAEMTNHFAVMTREILSVTREILSVTREVLSISNHFAVMTREVLLMMPHFA